jgi:hypothetical protein
MARPPQHGERAPGSARAPPHVRPPARARVEARAARARRCPTTDEMQSTLRRINEPCVYVMQSGRFAGRACERLRSQPLARRMASRRRAVGARRPCRPPPTIAVARVLVGVTPWHYMPLSAHFTSAEARVTWDLAADECLQNTTVGPFGDFYLRALERRARQIASHFAALLAERARMARDAQLKTGAAATAAAPGSWAALADLEARSYGVACVGEREEGHAACSKRHAPSQKFPARSAAHPLPLSVLVQTAR